MITVHEPQELSGTIVPRHVIEILCPNCGRDVDEFELAALECNDCGHNLSDPKQSVAIHATTVPGAGGKTLGQ